MILVVLEKIAHLNTFFPSSYSHTEEIRNSKLFRRRTCVSTRSSTSKLYATIKDIYRRATDIERGEVSCRSLGSVKFLSKSTLVPPLLAWNRRHQIDTMTLDSRGQVGSSSSETPTDVCQSALSQE